jgi:hypothetical protein
MKNASHLHFKKLLQVENAEDFTIKIWALI